MVELRFFNRSLFGSMVYTARSFNYTGYAYFAAGYFSPIVVHVVEGN